MPKLRDTNRNKDGTFSVGNRLGGQSPGAPPKRERLDDRMLYRAETPVEDQIKVSFTPADRWAVKACRVLDGTEGPDFMKQLKEFASIAYGDKTRADITGTLFGEIKRTIVKP